MSFDPVSAAFDLGSNLLEKIWPDPTKRAKELRKLEELKQNGNLAELNAHVQLMVGQLEINKIEAASKSMFVAGWRPFIGWVGGMALFYQFIMYPLLMWVWAVAIAKGYIPEGLDIPPVLETGALFSIVTALLGIGAMRSVDKKNNTKTDKL